MNDRNSCARILLIGMHVLRTIVIALSLFVLYGLSGYLFACDKNIYEYCYSFYVEGEHGSLCVMRGNKAVDSSESPIILMGGKNGGINLEFVATPDEGYRVKQWTINGQVVEGNNTDTFWCGYVRSNETVVTVEFMLEE